MNSKERVFTALSHKEPDRVPIGYSASSLAHQKLKEYLGIQDDEKLLERIGVDIRTVTPKIKFQATNICYADPTVKILDGPLYLDIWGVGFRPVQTKYETYLEVAYNPLQNKNNTQELDIYPWPNVNLWDYNVLLEQIEKVKKYAVHSHSRGFFEIAWFMRGMENFLSDLYLNEKFALKLMDKIKDYLQERIRKILEAGQGKIDIMEYNDDVGTQNGLLINPEKWRKFIKPRVKEVFTLIRSFGTKVMYHSCGGIREIIPDLIEIGLDILNPVQPRAKGMNPEELKKEYGNCLTFYGTIDEQQTLAFGSPKEVEKETLHNLKVVGENGGFIISPCHSIQPDTPCANIMALYDTCLSYKYSK